MAFEDLQDQLKEQWAELRGKIEESPAYNTLRERYENLSPAAQNGIKGGAIALVIGILIYFPYSYFSSSMDYVAIFEEKRTLIRKLLRASLTASQVGIADNPPPTSALIENIRGQLQSFNLLPEQIGAISELDKAQLGGNFAPPEIDQSGVQVELKKLNLRQVVDIGVRLQNLGPGLRLLGMQMTAGSPDPHYFDVSFKVARFGLPAESEPPADARSNRPGRGGDSE